MIGSIRRSMVISILVLAITVVFVSITLVIGRGPEGEPPVVVLGQPSPQDFVAPFADAFVDEQATAEARDLARNNTPVVYTIDPAPAAVVQGAIAIFFNDVRAAAEPPPVFEPEPGPEPEPTPSTLPPDTTEPGEGEGETTTTSTTTTTTTTTTTLPPRPEVEEQIAELETLYQAFPVELVAGYVTLHNEDLARLDAAEEPVEPRFDDIETKAVELADATLAEGIKVAELQGVKNRLIAEPRRVFISGFTTDELNLISDLNAALVAELLQSNEVIDEVATEDARDAAAAAVAEVKLEYTTNQIIVREGELIADPLQVEAIESFGLLEPAEEPRYVAITALGAIAVLLAAFFLWRVAPREWGEPRHFALLGVLLVLAAAAARLPEVISQTNPQLGYLLPAMLFGYLAAILFDPRTAVLLSIPMGIFTAVSTGDVGLTVFAAAATLTPVPFVSAVSSRRELRIGVTASAIALAPLGAVIEWLFRDFGDGAVLQPVAEAAGFAFVGGVAGGFVAQGLLSTLETMFQMTTTLTLLDLTDRNHPALRLLEEEAPGTFNHSILVGTLAGKAARAIDAEPLLAQAAAYYHDLGKTEAPQYFIENQFGVSNPHDSLPPIESAAIIRHHVIDGLRLARTYRIPPTVAAGIRQHHGTGLMRYFYHKAMEDDPAVDPDLFRHSGRKPIRKEMGILMLSDAVEGAARAMAQHEDPTSDSLRKLVERVVDEKVEDGQLDDCQLTFRDLTRVKDALVDALMGYYHTRISYPGFPGSEPG